MKLSTFSYDLVNGWSVESFPQLDSPRTLVIVFGGAQFIDAPAPIEQLLRAYPTSVVVGCSSAGEIHGGHIGDDGLSVAVVEFERGAIRLARADVSSGEGSRAAGEKIGQQLLAPDLRAVFVLSDGISVNGTALLSGIHSVLPPTVSVTGGLAGDGSRFQRTWVLAQGRPTSGTVVAVGLCGESIGVSHGSRGGWDAFGPERLVTGSAGNVLRTLDDEPALALYKTYLGDRAEGLPATALLFPLALRAASSSQTVVRTILAVDEEAQTMTFAGDIPEGAIAQLMRANFDRLIDGASKASEAAGMPGSGDSLTIAVSCVGRRLVLGERAEEEVEAASEGLSPGSQLIGFYSYGEISPFVAGECGVLHNQTMTLTRFWEH